MNARPPRFWLVTHFTVVAYSVGFALLIADVTAAALWLGRQ